MPEDDATLLAERVGALSTEVEMLRAKNQDLRYRLDCRQRRVRLSHFLGQFGSFIFAVAAVGGAAFLGYVMQTAPDTASHCYIKGASRTVNAERENCVERHERYFLLYRSIPWDRDSSVGEFGTLEAATKAAHDIGCPLR